MNGPLHYQRAEALLEQSASGNMEVAEWQVRKAEVHAMLAQVAATIETAASRGPGDVSQVWIEAVT